MKCKSLVGNLLKILHVDHDGKNICIYFRTQEGQIGRKCNLKKGDTIKPDDVIILGQNKWDFVPADLWQESSQIATVRRVLGESDVLVDDSIGHLRRVRKLNGIAVKVGNVIEYNDTQGVLSILSERPIKSSFLGDDTENVESEYLIDEAGAGPTFKDFGGYPHVVARAKELIETQLARWEQLEKIGARPIKGVLFAGHPGTGKTHLARIIASESNAQFYAISGPEIISKWLGDTEGKLRKIFDAAANSDNGRAIIFFDEIDSIAEKRSSDSHEASKRLVAQLLTLMDGFDNKGKNVIVIAATNRVDTLEPALTRPGRFDWEIEFGLPTRSDRYDILKVAGKHLKIAPDLPLEDVADLTEGWSAAELTFIWTEAALLAVGDSRKEVAAEDFVQAFERISLRPRRSIVAEGAV